MVMDRAAAPCLRRICRAVGLVFANGTTTAPLHAIPVFGRLYPPFPASLPSWSRTVLTRRSLPLVLAAVVLTIVAALPAADAAQTQRLPVTRPQSNAAVVESSADKSIVLRDTRAREELEKRVELLEKQVVALQASQAEMQKVTTELQRTVSTLQANALPVQRQGSDYIVNVPAGLTLHGASLTLQGDVAATLKAGAKMDVNAPTVNIGAQAVMDLKGATIKLNAGSSGKGAARSGDQASCNAATVGVPTHCTIATASSTVLIGS